jgi:hypothetical protein
VQGNLVPGAADGDVGQAFILHAPAANLYTIICTAFMGAMDEKTKIASVRN